MQIVDTVPDGRPRVLGPSLALDLDWAVHAASSEYLREIHPVLRRTYEGDPALAARVGGFWADGISCLPEMDVLAHHARALEVTELDELLTAVESGLRTIAPETLGLASETPADRDAIIARLGTLKSSKTRRVAWRTLLGEVWEHVDAWWRAEGVPGVERAGAQMRADLDRGGEWRTLVTSGCEVFRSHIPSIEQRLRVGQTELLLAPSALFGRGLYLDLPGTVLVGYGAGRDGGDARARTEQMARRLRALSDPTRLAILDHLGRGASSVTELARAFGLSQPTVSAHVKHLREAGLVSAERRGTRLEVAVDRDALAALGGEIGNLLAPAGTEAQ
jgi:ArsR family transcriptional regulator